MPNVGISAVRCPQVSDIKPTGKPNKYFLQLTDGGAVANAIATTQVGKRIAAAEIKDGDVVDLTSYSFNSETGEDRIFMIDVGTVHRGTKVISPLSPPRPPLRASPSLIALATASV